MAGEIKRRLFHFDLYASTTNLIFVLFWVSIVPLSYCPSYIDVLL